MGKKTRNDKNGSEVVSGQKENYNARNEDLNRNNRQPTQQSKYNQRITQEEDSKDYSSFKIVLFYCSLIVFLPVVTFFLLKSYLLERFFVLSEVKGNIYSAVGAVVALHIALALYIYRAYFSGGSSDSSHKKIN